MKSTQFCEIEWLEHILLTAKASGHTHFRILPCGSFAGFEFGSSGKRGWYRPSVEDMSITGKECVEYFCTNISWDEYMDIRNKAMDRFYGMDEEE
jgi:hypothetical protein